MRKLPKKIYIIILLYAFSIIPACTYAQEQNNEIDKTLKIGFYDYKPYYYIDENEKIKGYYNDLVELLSKKLNFKYEYKTYNFADSVKALEEGKIDLMMGLHKNEYRTNRLLYIDHYIGIEKFGVYTNKYIKYGDLKKLEGLKFANIKDEENSNWMLKFLKDKQIKIKTIEVKSYGESIKLLKEKKVDFIVAAVGNEDIKNMRKIYEYVAGPVYIAGNKDEKLNLSKIDRALDEFENLEENPIKDLQNKYIYIDNTKDSEVNSLIMLLVLLVALFSVFIFYSSALPKLKKKKVQNLIRERIHNNEYMLYYQPIVNPNKNEIVGFESLLRLKCKKGGVLSPALFLDEIEDNGMLFEISIWVLERAIEDYKDIVNKDVAKQNNFYISINVSLKEIENEEFINKAKKILFDSNIGINKICLEIVEKVGINNVNKMKKFIKELKKIGFIIAIDDFGVEYSNLDILEKLDFDIIKLDKSFVDSIEVSKVGNEIMEFVSNLCVITNKSLIAEGVESLEQKDIIKKIRNDKFYIQGYFYSKPLPIEELNNIEI